MEFCALVFDITKIDLFHKLIINFTIVFVALFPILIVLPLSGQTYTYSFIALVIRQLESAPSSSPSDLFSILVS